MAGNLRKFSSVGVIALLAGTAPLAIGLRAGAEPLTSFGYGTFGTPGLIDMPTAETRPDGEFGATVAARSGDTRGSFAFQILPRLSGALHFSTSDDLGPGGTTRDDRSFDLHWQVLEENGWRPAVAIGMRDILGDAHYGSEYLVATKTLSPRLRATAGLGWGRLATKGASGGGSRPAADTNGGLNSDAWFRGPVAPFAGLAWQATDKLTLKAEVSSDAYLDEVGAGFDRKTSVNLGADYRFNKMLSLGAYYLHGSEVGLQFNIALDPRDPPAPSGLEKAPLPVRPRPAPGADAEAWSGAWSADPTARPVIQRTLAEAMAKDGQVLEAMALSTDAVELRVRNETYDARPQAIGHIARMLTRAMPATVETFTITLVERGMPVSSTTLKRSDIEALENGASNELLARAEIGEAGAASVTGAAFSPNDDLYPRLKWAISPYLELSNHVEGQDQRADVGLQFKGRYELAPNLVLSGTLRQKALGNLDESTYVSPSPVPHVRSDFAEYQKEGDLTVQNLTLAWYGRPAENLYARVTAGYLERMYGGVSGEILWKPVDSRLALGAEVNYVKQRDFDQHFGFRDYDTVSGHLSAYYDFGKGITGQLDVGRYLAEDWGATVSVDRRLANGWTVGAFATVTDMDSADFGPGSFDKGLRISIPLSWASGKPTLATFDQTIRPFTGDGGARVEVEGRLYETIRDGHVGALYEDWGRVWR